MNQTFKLNNDIQIPSIGFGTWQTPDGETAKNAIKIAVENGYRHIDAAAIYNNEKGVGTGIKECGVKREALFVTSKVWNSERGFASTLKAFNKTLDDLQLDYLDLYLIHWPATSHQFDNWQQLNIDTWRAMEELHNNGKIRAIGVSNFLKHHLEPLLESAYIKPSVNQIEYHPGYKQKEIMEYCKDHNILIEGWSPLGRGKVLQNEHLKSIAKKHQKTVAQVCIRWAIQNEVLPLPKSITPHRIKENIEVFDFDISKSDMDIIDQLETFGNSGLHPDYVEF